MTDQTTQRRRSLAILGVRGVPAAHGGFETFAARLAPYLASNGWDVTVYCQESDSSPELPSVRAVWESSWEGIRRVHITVPSDSAVNSIRFDWLSIAHVVKNPPTAVLILGYNTAVFAARLRIAGIPTVINMDGMEWRRAKWGPLAKLWLYWNERAACKLAHHLIADHPQIENHLQTRCEAEKISVIPYGSDLIERRADLTSDVQNVILTRLGLLPKCFATIIARAEPENSILEIVKAFSAKARGISLVVLGNYYRDRVPYHAEVVDAASPEVLFPGAIYDSYDVQALRRHTLFYFHGHRVGGCNPSLLEAMGAGNAVIAHDNPFNRWVVREGARYFTDVESCQQLIEDYIQDPLPLERQSELNRLRAEQVFDWGQVQQSYSELLEAVARQVTEASESEWIARAQWRLDAPS